MRHVMSQQYETCIFSLVIHMQHRKDYTSALIFYYAFKIKPILQSFVQLLFKNSSIITQSPFSLPVYIFVSPCTLLGLGCKQGLDRL